MKKRLLCSLLLLLSSQSSNAMTTGVDGSLLVEQDMSLNGNDGVFDFLSFTVNSGATLSADSQSYPGGISISSLGDVYINGIVDFSGIDLSITTPGTFEVGPSGGFLADNYSINAGSVILSDNFQVVPGGTIDISDGPVGETLNGTSGQAQISISGYGVSLTHYLIPAIGGEPAIVPFQNVALVPLPASILLLMFPLWLMRFTGLNGTA